MLADVENGAVIEVTALDAYVEHGLLFSSSIVITEPHRAALRAGVDVASAWNVIA